MSTVEGVATGELLESNDSVTMLDFAREFINNPTEVASVLPSSSFLYRRIAKLANLDPANLDSANLDSANLDPANYIVDLGPGLGGTTKSLLRRSCEDANVLAVETNETFVAHLRQSTDLRLSVVNRSAVDLRQILEEHRWPHADLIVSGVPFSTMDARTSHAVIDAIYTVLKPGGSFIAYQLRDRVCELADPLFGAPTTSFVWRNLPPLRVFHWQKLSC